MSQLSNEEPELKQLLMAAVYSYGALHSKEGEKDKLNIGWSALAKSDTGYTKHSLKKIDQLKLSRSTIKAIARFGFSQALMGQAWLNLWLEKAQYDNPQELIAEILSQQPISVTQSISHNIFVRKYARGENAKYGPNFDEIVSALNHQVAIVAVTGTYGSGRTTALEDVAWDYTREGGSVFRYVIWLEHLDASSNPFNSFLDTIIRVAEYSNFLDWPLSVKSETVRRLIRFNPTLVVVDEVDRIESDELRTFLEQMPAPSKALVSGNEDLNMRCSINVSLTRVNPGSNLQAWTEVINESVARYPELDRRLIEDCFFKADSILMARVMVARAHIQKKQGIYAETELTDLKAYMRETCGLLSEAGRSVLSALVPFPLYASYDALRYVASKLKDQNSTEDFSEQFRKGLNELDSFNLLRRNNESGPYRWHDLLREIAIEKTSESQRESAYEAWIKYYCELVEDVSFCPDDERGKKLKRLDPEIDSLPRVINYVADLLDVRDEAKSKTYCRYALRLGHSTYYYYVRGLWSYKDSPHKVAVVAARKLGKKSEELYHLSFEVEWLAKRGSFEKIRSEQYLKRMKSLYESKDTDDQSKIVYLLSLACYLMESENWESTLRFIELEGSAEPLLQEAMRIAETQEKVHPDSTIRYFRFLAIYRLGLFYSSRKERGVQACLVLEEGIKEALNYKDRRIAAEMQLVLAKVLLIQDGLMISAKYSLDDVQELILKAEETIGIIEDRAQRAYLSEVQGLFKLQEHDSDGAYRSLREAEHLYYEHGQHTLALQVSRLRSSYFPKYR